MRPVLQGRTVTDLRLLLIGSGSFAVPAFEALATRHPTRIVGVITSAPQQSGRNGTFSATLVASWARERGLPLLEVRRLREPTTQEEIAALGANVGVLADFGQIVPVATLRAIPRGLLNLHPSLLPAHRGASPIPGTILAGDRETGVSTILMDEGLDTGPLLATQRHRLRGDEDAPGLEAELARLAAEGIPQTLHGYLEGEITPRPQPADGASSTRRLLRSDGEICSSWTAERAHRAWRAFRPWPGIWISLAPILERVRLDVVGEPLADVEVPLGKLRLHDGVLLLGLVGGALPLLEVTPPGGRRMSGDALVRGRPELVAERARIRP